MCGFSIPGFPDARPPPGAFSFGDNEGIPPKRQRYEPPGYVVVVGTFTKLETGCGA